MKCYIKPIIRDDKPVKRNGKFPIYFYISTGNEDTKVRAKWDIEKYHWDKKTGRVLNTSKIANELNAFLDSKTIALQTYSLKMSIMSKKLTKKMLKEAMKELITEKSVESLILSMKSDVANNEKREKHGNDDFYVFWEKQISLATAKKSTLEGYRHTLSVLKQFRPEVKFKDLNFEFIEELEFYLVNIKGNKKGGSIHKIVRKFINIALKKGLMTDYPYKFFKVLKSKPRQDYLTIEHLKQLEELEIPPDCTGVSKARDIFVFACYTGLRFSDFKKMTYDNLIISPNGKYTLKFSTQKTDTFIYLPLADKAIEIIRKYENHSDKIQNQLLPVQCYGRWRTLLEKLDKLYPVDQKLYAHLARHTFASMAISLGVNLKVLQNLMGYSDISQTAQYAKTTNELLDNAIELFNNK
jgi:site-specific recombinase XerD